MLWTVGLVAGLLGDGPAGLNSGSCNIGEEIFGLAIILPGSDIFILVVFLARAGLLCQCRLCSAKGSFGIGGSGLSKSSGAVFVDLLDFGRRMSVVLIAPRLCSEGRRTGSWGTVLSSPVLSSPVLRSAFPARSSMLLSSSCTWVRDLCIFDFALSRRA